MAAKYRKIDPRTWNDEEFRQLAPRMKLIALYILTAQSNRVGIFNYAHDTAIRQMKMPKGEYYADIEQVLKAFGWKYDESVGVIYIPSWWKYNQPINPSHLKGCMEDLHDLPKTSLLNEFTANTQWMPEPFVQTFHECLKRYYGTSGHDVSHDVLDDVLHDVSHDVLDDVPHQKLKQKLKQDISSAVAEAAGESSEGKAAKTQKAKAVDRKEATGDHQELIRHFSGAWKARHGSEYAFAGGKDGDAVKWMLSQPKMSLAEAKRIVDSYLADEDQFVSSAAHPLALLRSRFNQYRAKPASRNGRLTPGKNVTYSDA